MQIADRSTRAQRDAAAASRTGSAARLRDGIGRHLLGAMLALLGVLMIANRQFSASWQLVPEDLPARPLLAALLGAWLLVAGLALQLQRFARVAGVMAAIALLVGFVSFVPLIAERGLTYNPWLHLSEQAIMAMGAGLVAARAGPAWNRTGARRLRLACIGLGICELALAFTHLAALDGTARLVPDWIPPGPYAWAVLTAIFHFAAAIALISGECALLAARALVVMFAGFSLLVWGRIVLLDPGWQMFAIFALSWAMTGAVWVLADALARERRARRGGESALAPDSAPAGAGGMAGR